MLESKAWNWNIAAAPHWEEPASEVYPLVARWHKMNFTGLLDLGCGIGRHSIFFARNGFQVEAFDLSKDGIQKLMEKTNRLKLKITYAVGDMLHLPYKNNSFDAVICYHTIYHSDDEGIKQGISEIKRVLTPGGEAFISFNSQSNSAFSDNENIHITSHTIYKTKGHEAQIPHYYATKPDVENLLNGFQIVDFFHKEEYWNQDNYVSAHYYVLVKNIKN